MLDPLTPRRLGVKTSSLFTHDYKRHGTTTLFAALNVLDGTVIGRNMQRHRHQEFIRFLNAIEEQVPAGKTINAIVDNYANSQTSQGAPMACPPSPLDFPLHSHFGVLAQRRRGIFRNAHKAAAETRRVPIRRRSPSRHQSLPRRAQPAIEAFHMDRRSRQNHRSCQTRAPSVRFDPIGDGLSERVSGGL